MDFTEFKEKFVILIVDDNEDNVFTLSHRLRHDGYQNLLIAKDGLEALVAVNSNQIHLILLDIMMPRMSGTEVLKNLKEKIIRHEFSVLMISSADSIENIIECIELGADDFLPKPFNIHILRARIGACVEKHWHLYQENVYKQKIEEEKKRYFEVLNAVFPSTIVKEMIDTGTVKPKSLSNVSILFADVVGFTHYTENHEPQELLINLQHFIDSCELAATRHGVEKIKTIGDSFMAAAGMLEKVDHPVLACINWAREVIVQMKTSPSQWQIRVSIATGNVICGIIGNREYLFDVWGDCVNLASRLQTIALPNTISLTEAAWQTLAGLNIAGHFVGEFKMKGKNELCKVYEIE